MLTQRRNERLRRLSGTVTWLIRGLATDTSIWADDVWVVGSTPSECGRSREAVRRSELAGWAEYGCCASHSRYWSLRLHLIATLHGLPVGFAVSGATADERQVLLDLLGTDPALVPSHPGQILITDEHYYGRRFETELADAGLTLVRGPAAVDPTGPARRSPDRCARPSSRSSTPSKASSTSSCTAAIPPAVWHNDHTSRTVRRSLLAYDH